MEAKERGCWPEAGEAEQVSLNNGRFEGQWEGVLPAPWAENHVIAGSVCLFRPVHQAPGIKVR